MSRKMVGKIKVAARLEFLEGVPRACRLVLWRAAVGNQGGPWMPVSLRSWMGEDGNCLPSNSSYSLLQPFPEE